MARPKGSPKTPGSGRKAGTPNKSTKTLLEICEEEGIEPFRALCKFAKDPDPSVALRAVERMCEYLYPKRKALEISGDIDMKLVDRVKELQALPDAELKKLAGQ